MTLMKNIKWILIVSILISCNNSRNDKAISMNDPGRPLSELKKLAINQGDTDAYYSLSITYLDLPHGDFLPIAEEMAKKHDYAQAYFDVYFQLLKSTDAPGTTLSLDSCDEETRNKAIRYLRLAFEKKHEQSIDELGELYYEGKFLSKDTILGRELIDKYDSVRVYKLNMDNK